MSALFSKSCQYALQAMLYLASQPQGEPVLLRDVSAALRIPQHFLSKILQTLTRNRLLVSFKGVNGGFQLARSARETYLIEIVRATDGEAFLDNCVLGFPGCGDDNPCPVHPMWKRAKQLILNMLKNKNIEQLSKEVDVKLDFIEQLTK
ncbi:MAG TPA: Rrf2 family transcriptional regulator [Bacteroidota bacterium]